MNIIEYAPAKINLGLKVISKRKDGYHNIISIFQTVDLYDELTITSKDPGLICTNPEVPTDSENLVFKAEELLRKRHDNFPCAHFTLKKRIPVGAGLAGGSSDAAATLRGLKNFHGIDINDNVLCEYACELGSDVPFHIKGGTSVVTGRGEIVENIKWPFDFTYVIVYPNFSVSTAWAYRNLRKIGKNYSTYEKMTDKLKKKFSLDSNELFNVLENDFEEPVFKKYPVLNEIKARLINNEARKVLLTGSGSAVIGIFEDNEKAAFCTNSLNSSKFEIYKVKMLFRKK